MLHHLALTGSNLKASAAIYETIMTALGYERVIDKEDLVAWNKPGVAPELLLYQAAPDLQGRAHTLYQPGFHHLAFQAESRGQIDHIHQALVDQNACITDPPKAYPNYPGDYYALFLRDPDGLKVEIMIN